MTYPADDASKLPPQQPYRYPLDEDDEPEIIIDISPGDEIDDDDLDDELERGYRDIVSYEIDDEPTGPRRAS